MATVNVIIGDRLFLSSFAVIVNERRMIAFLTENCFYLLLRSKMRT